MSYDSLTEWPSPEKLPRGFNPEELLENAKSPGLGVRALHAEGIDGKGIGLAIIDQPLLLGHEEYTHRLVRYDATGLSQMPPQMHGPPVASIAVGKNLGVAPGATLTYFAVPTWKRSNLPYIQSLKRIMELNKSLPEDERIRVISISTGMFRHYEHYKEWEKVLHQAETSGILVVTCDPEFVNYGMLSLAPGADPADFRNYSPGSYSSEKDIIRVPGSNKTMASHRGNDVYTFDRSGGMSWGAPYIAGLAALAFQVNPDLKPEEILKILLRTATPTQTIPIVNPRAFIEAARK
jgi:subtilisin family serine protease